MAKPVNNIGLNIEQLLAKLDKSLALAESKTQSIREHIAIIKKSQLELLKSS